MRFAALLLFPLAAAFAGCGDDGGDRGRPVTPADLAEIVLQRDDVDVGVLGEPIVQGDENSNAYGHQFEVPPDDAGEGETVCVTAALALYHSPSAARDAFDAVRDSIDQLVASSNPGRTVQRVAVPGLGDESDGIRTSSPSTAYCFSYQDAPLDGHTVYFRDHDVLASVAVRTLGGEAAVFDAIDLARAQLERLQQFRATEAP